MVGLDACRLSCQRRSWSRAVPEKFCCSVCLTSCEVSRRTSCSSAGQNNKKHFFIKGVCKRVIGPVTRTHGSGTAASEQQNIQPVKGAQRSREYARCSLRPPPANAHTASITRDKLQATAETRGLSPPRPCSATPIALFARLCSTLMTMGTLRPPGWPVRYKQQHAATQKQRKTPVINLTARHSTQTGSDLDTGCV